MTTWKTYLMIWHSSEGDNPYVVMEKLSSMGFVPTIGHYDLEYDHGKKVGLSEIMSLMVKVHETLKGSQVMYKIETIPSDEEPTLSPLAEPKKEPKKDTKKK